jgi:hypothetical protein
MNAGGVPNTCKSSGKASTGYLIELGREISKKFRIITKEERWLSFLTRGEVPGTSHHHNDGEIKLRVEVHERRTAE